MRSNSVLMVILLFVVMLAVWSGYRYFIVAPEWVDEFIAKPTIYLLPILLSGNTFASLGVTRQKYWTYAFFGLGLGVLLLFESLMTRYVKYGTLEILSFTPMTLVYNLIISFATAFVEETVFRGYFFQQFFQLQNSEVFANVVSSICFVLAHLPLALFSFHYTGGELAGYCFQIFLLGSIFSYVFAQVKTIVPTTIAHTLWNFTNVFVK